MPSASGSARPFPCQGSRPASTRMALHHYGAAVPHCPHRPSLFCLWGHAARGGALFPAGGVLRVGGQVSGPRRRRMPPSGRTRTRRRGMSPLAGEGWQHRSRDREPRPAQPRQPGRRRDPADAAAARGRSGTTGGRPDGTPGTAGVLTPCLPHQKTPHPKERPQHQESPSQGKSPKGEHHKKKSPFCEGLSSSGEGTGANTPASHQQLMIMGTDRARHGPAAPAGRQ